MTLNKLLRSFGLLHSTMHVETLTIFAASSLFMYRIEMKWALKHIERYRNHHSVTGRVWACGREECESRASAEGAQTPPSVPPTNRASESSCWLALPPTALRTLLLTPHWCHQSLWSPTITWGRGGGLMAYCLSLYLFLSIHLPHPPSLRTPPSHSFSLQEHVSLEPGSRCVSEESSPCPFWSTVGQFTAARLVWYSVSTVVLQGKSTKYLFFNN